MMLKFGGAIVVGLVVGLFLAVALLVVGAPLLNQLFS